MFTRLTFAMLLVVAACDERVREPNEAGTPPVVITEPIGCRRPSDCGVNRFDYVCTGDGRCIKLCTSDSNCADGSQCVDGSCLAGRCLTDGDCADDARCLEGQCREIGTGATHCEVIPDERVLVGRHTVELRVEATTTNGDPALTTSVEWSGDGVAFFSVDDPSRVEAAFPGEFGSMRVGAKVGGLVCSEGVVNVVAPLIDEAGPLLVAFDPFDGRPIANAWVQVKRGEQVVERRTDASGRAALLVGTEPYDVHVFAPGHRAVSFLGLQSLVVRAELAAIGTGTVQSTLADTAFDNLADFQGNVRFAVAGRPMRGGPATWRLDEMMGEPASMTFEYGSSLLPLDLPNGGVMGLGDHMARTSFRVERVREDERLWMLGANSRIEFLSQFVSRTGNGASAWAPLGQLMFPFALGRDVQLALFDRDIPSEAFEPDWLPRSLERLSFAPPQRPAGLDALVSMVTVEDDQGGLVPVALSAVAAHPETGALLALSHEVTDRIDLRLSPRPHKLRANHRRLRVMALDTKAGSESLATTPLIRAGLAVDVAEGLTDGVRAFEPGFPTPFTHVGRVGRTLEIEGNQATFSSLHVEAGAWDLYASPRATISIPRPPEELADPFADATQVLVHGYVTTTTLDDLAHDGAHTWRKIDAWVTREAELPTP